MTVYQNSPFVPWPFATANIIKVIGKIINMIAPRPIMKLFLPLINPMNAAKANNK